jgi:acyl-phosphate glycerol 3-phosphate acyltransferase
MTALATLGITILTAYLIGAIPFGYLVARWRGVDIFREGSGNIGATNVGRVLGRRFGILVFVLDLAKGALPALVAGWIAQGWSDGPDELLGPDGLRVCAGLAALLGHLFSIYLRFRGGKGVATGAGVVAVLLPGPTLGALFTWLAVVIATRYVSLASLSAALALCVLRFGLIDQPFAPDNRILSLFCLVAAGLVFARHRANLGRLFHGTENRLRESLTMFFLGKMLHVLSLGLWFGMLVFFTFVVGLTLFNTFEHLAEKPSAERPNWFPLPPEFDKDAQTRKDQGTRVAGAAVSPMFPVFFLLQGVCGFLAVLPALAWWREHPGERIHKVRAFLLLLALATVVAGWPLEQEVSKLGIRRHATADAVLQNPPPVPESLTVAALEARKEFGRWHFYSLMLTFVTVIFVTGAMALAAGLPRGRVDAPAQNQTTSPTNPPVVEHMQAEKRLS